MFLLYRATLNLLFVILVAIIIGWLFSDIVIYLLISLIISSVLRPITDYITSIEVFKVKIPRSLAIFFAFALLAILLSSFLLLFAPVISDQIRLLSGLDYPSLLKQIQKPIASIETFLITNFQMNEKPYIVPTFEIDIDGSPSVFGGRCNIVHLDIANFLFD